MARAFGWWIAVGVGFVSCAEAEHEAPAGALPAAHPSERVIATLHTSDSVLTVTSAPSGLRYSLVGADGEARPDLTLEELEAHDSSLSELVRSAIAASGGPRLDARVFRTESEPVRADRAAPPLRR